MAKLVHNYGGGTTDEYGTDLVLNRFLTGDIIEGLSVTANGTPNMTVLVQPGSGRITTGTYPSSYGYLFSIDTTGGESVTIGTAAASDRIDYIVAYIDKSVVGSTSPTYVNNTNAVLKLADVQGTPAGSPSVPTVSQIQTAIGAANPYVILEQVYVAANVTQITSSNLTDKRTFIRSANPATLSNNSYVDSGCIWSAGSGLNAAMTAGTIHINIAGVLVPVNLAAISSLALTASSDNYIYANILGQVSFLAVTNNTVSPTLPANSIWLSQIVTNGSTITLVNQGATPLTATVLPPIVNGVRTWKFDTNGNRIFPAIPRSTQRVYDARVSSASTGSPGGTPVSYNGFSGTYKFNMVAGVTYDICILEPNINPSGSSGIANFTLSFLINGTIVGQFNKEVTQVALSFGDLVVIPFTATSTGVASLSFQLSSAGASYSYTMNATTSGPAFAEVREQS